MTPRIRHTEQAGWATTPDREVQHHTDARLVNYSPSNQTQAQFLIRSSYQLDLLAAPHHRTDKDHTRSTCRIIRNRPPKRRANRWKATAGEPIPIEWQPRSRRRFRRTEGEDAGVWCTAPTSSSASVPEPSYHSPELGSAPGARDSLLREIAWIAGSRPTNVRRLRGAEQVDKHLAAHLAPGRGAAAQSSRSCRAPGRLRRGAAGRRQQAPHRPGLVLSGWGLLGAVRVNFR